MGLNFQVQFLQVTDFRIPFVLSILISADKAMFPPRVVFSQGLFNSSAMSAFTAELVCTNIRIFCYLLPLLAYTVSGKRTSEKIDACNNVSYMFRGWKSLDCSSEKDKLNVQEMLEVTLRRACKKQGELRNEWRNL